MKILYISEGVTTHDQRFLRAISGGGHEVDFLSARKNCAATIHPPDGVALVETPENDLLSSDRAGEQDAVSWLRQLSENGQYDLVLAGPVPTLGYLAVAACQTPVVVISWGSDMLVDVWKDRLSQDKARYALDGATGVLVDCITVRDSVQNVADVEDDGILMMPYGIDLDAYTRKSRGTELRQKLGWNDKKVIVSNRSWEPHYRIDVVLDAFHRAVGVDDAMRLLLVGDGSLHDDVQSRISESGLGDSVVTPGRIANGEMASYLSAADLYVSASLSDGTSISMLEAMACGLPVIVTEGSGNPEWVKESENGWLVNAGKPDELARGILTAFDDPNALSRMGRRNIEVVRERADWSANSRRLLHFLELRSEASCNREGA